jgi:hypothetical protein
MMSALKQSCKIVAAFGLVATMAALAIFVLPPWWGKRVYMIHVHTHIPYAFGWPPKHFSGVWRDYNSDGKYVELSYKNGKRHGIQRYYNVKGSLVRSCEFRSGEPWAGLCDFWEHKPWLAEYRDGKVWKGAMQEFDDKQQDYVTKYYFEGKLYSEVDFRRLMGFGDAGSLIGAMCVTSRPR